MQGYTVFVVDEPCFAGRDSKGELQPNSTTWPHGFKAFGQFLFERGMELGIYTDAGPRTCQGCPASAGHEAQDMATFISWGASYVKVDRCFGVDSDAMRESLPSTFSGGAGVLDWCSSIRNRAGCRSEDDCDDDYDG